MNRKQVFVVVATGQKIANLPPVLECANRGDKVVWIESNDARRGNWSEGSRRVFENHGLINLPSIVTVDDINDPVHVAEQLRSIIAELGPSHTLNLVANGGPKLAPIGLLNACRSYKSRLLYGNPKPAELWIFDGAMLQPPEKHAYHRHKIDLKDILIVNDLILTEDATPLLLEGSVSDTQCEYGNNPEFTSKVHDEYYLWYQSDVEQKTIEPSFKEIEELLRSGMLYKNGYDIWLNSLASIFQNGFAQGRNHSRHPSPSISEITAILQKKMGSLATVYNAARTFSRKATLAKTKSIRNVSAPTIHLGQEFEQAVALRLLVYLSTQPRLMAVIQSVWKNVKVAQTKSPHIVQAEWDILIVFKSGVLLSIECKSFSADQKDLDARLRNLQRVGSLAELLICGPVYTNFIKEPWFSVMHKLKEKVGPKDFLPFTLLKQPEKYIMKNEQGEEKNHTCAAFETILTQRLNSYIPHFP